MTGSSGFMPPPLIEAIKGELVAAQARRTYDFSVEFRVKGGVATEARVRSREVLHVVSLST